MKKVVFAMAVCLAVSLGVAPGAPAAGRKLPAAQEKKAVASVNGELITLDAFHQALASPPGESAGGGKEGTAVDKAEVLRRLVNAKLIAQEGRRMGLDELPEIKNMVDVYAKITLREHLLEWQLRNVRKADAKEVEKLYRAAIGEWKMSGLLFAKEDEARNMVEELRRGKDFNKLSGELIAAGTAKPSEEERYLKMKDMNQEIARVVSAMKPGSVSSPIPTKEGFVVLKLESARFPENAAEKERARREALQNKKVDALKKFNNSLMKKYVKLHKNVLDGIDYEAEAPGFQELLKDGRVVAEIRGEPPVTVGELSEQLRQQLYHGVDRAIESKRLNAKKVQTLDEMLYKRVFRKEALRLGLDRNRRYADKVREYEDSVIFGAFVQKAVVPDVSLKEEALKTYYEEHLGEYTLPEMMRIRGIVFAGRADAEEAIEKLRKGTDFQWLLANAEGQVDKNTPGILVFDGKLVAASELPEGVRKLTSGTKAGDSRLYAAPGGYFYVLSLQEVIPPRPMSYEETRKGIAGKLFDEDLKAALDRWIDKLRAAADIKVYLKEGR